PTSRRLRASPQGGPQSTTLPPLNATRGFSGGTLPPPARAQSGPHSGCSPRVPAGWPRLTVAASRPLGKAHGLLRRLEESADFIEALLLFCGGGAVGDNFGPPPHIYRAILDERRSQHNAAVHLALGREGAAAAAVGSALLHREPADAPQRVSLRGAGERAGWEARHQCIDNVAPPVEPPDDVADDVHDVAVALDREALGHSHGADLGHAPHVI